jgi:gas vesicle protein
MSNEVLNTDSQQSASMGSSMAIFLGGATVGAIAALLLAPQAGQESRKQLSEYGRRTGETMSEWATAAYSLFATRENGHAAKQGAAVKHHEPNEMVKSRSLA